MLEVVRYVAVQFGVHAASPTAAMLHAAALLRRRRASTMACLALASPVFMVPDAPATDQCAAASTQGGHV